MNTTLLTWKSKKLCDIGVDVDRWLADGKQLVDEGKEYAEEYPNSPCTDGRARGASVIFITDNRSHFGVRRIVGY